LFAVARGGKEWLFQDQVPGKGIDSFFDFQRT
jgi:hypothetical protein